VPSKQNHNSISTRVPSNLLLLANTSEKNKPNNSITLYYQNIRGSRTKLPKIYLNSKTLDYDIYVLTETWIYPSINSLEIFDNSYAVFRKDRYDNNYLIENNLDIAPYGGGVLIAVKNSFNCVNISLPEFPYSDDNPSFEIVAVKIQFNSYSLFLINCYVPPKSGSEIFSNLLFCIHTVVKLLNPSDKILVIGDFNLPQITWIPNEDCYFIPKNDLKDFLSSFVDYFNSNDLQQFSHIKNFQNNQLDLCFSSDWKNFSFSNFPSPLSVIDKYHPPICLKFNLLDKISYKYPSPSLKFNFSKTDFLSLNCYLSEIDFTSINKLNLNEALRFFYNTLNQSFELFVPKVQTKGNSSNTPWIRRNLAQLKNKKNKAWNSYQKTKNQNKYIQFVNLYTLYKNSLELSYTNYVEKVGSQIKTDPKSFWRFINDKRKSDEYPNFMNYGDNCSDSTEIITEYFKHFFSSTYETDPFLVNPNNFDHIIKQPEIQNFSSYIDLSSSRIKNYLDKLTKESSPGPDGVPNVILKFCSEALAAPLSTLFQKSFDSNIFRQEWKRSFVKPVYKKGNKNLISNYRPITKLNSIPKLFELLVYDSIYDICSKFLAPNQHGFVKNRSTITNLVNFTSSTIKHIENGQEVDVIYTDLSKAFDLIPHSIIKFKLQSLGFPQSFINWIASYLDNRQYSVTFRNHCSEYYSANSGVSQGSHVGPLFLLLSTNDIVSIVKNCEIDIFADDMKFRMPISNVGDSLLFQQDLNRVFKWFQDNGLKLNVSKCANINFTRKNKPFNFQYNFNEEIIKKVTVIDDLGLRVDHRLTFIPHYNKMINKANSMCGFIRRWAKEFDDPYVTKALYTSLVRPSLEYASPVWSPSYQDHINRIESVQKKFLIFALRSLNWENPLHLPPYHERLQLINLKSLETRRTVSDILFISQIINGKIDCITLKNIIESLIKNNPRTRSHEIFKIVFHRTNYGKFEPINRILSKINSLYCHIDFSVLFSLPKKDQKEILFNSLSNLNIT